MRGFLTQLVTRARQAVPPIQPRPHALFEPTRRAPFRELLAPPALLETENKFAPIQPARGAVSPRATRTVAEMISEIEHITPRRIVHETRVLPAQTELESKFETPTPETVSRRVSVAEPLIARKEAVMPTPQLSPRENLPPRSVATERAPLSSPARVSETAVRAPMVVSIAQSPAPVQAQPARIPSKSETRIPRRAMMESPAPFLSPRPALVPPPTPVAVQPLLAQHHASSQAAPIIHVTIGRLEVRAVASPPPAASTAAPLPLPKLSLEEYLRGGKA